MEYTYTQLKGKKVSELREIAAGLEHEAVRGYTQLNKEHLLEALCKALNVDTHTRRKVKAAGFDKAGVKVKIKALKIKRDAAIEAHNRTDLKAIRKELHKLRRSLRKAALAAPAK